MATDDLLELESFAFPFNAKLAQAALESSGVTVFVENYHVVSANWLWANMLGGVRLMVPESQFEEAKSILASLEFYSGIRDEAVEEVGDLEDQDPPSR